MPPDHADLDLEDVRLEVEQRVATITLDRPDRLNAFTGAMGRSLGRAYAWCDATEEVRAVVLTGAGRGFCAGADVGGGGDTFGKPSGGFTAAPVDPPAWAVRKPVIAAIAGPAVGIGLSLAMQCDVRLVAREAKCGFVHVRRGVLPDVSAHWTVPRAIGFPRAAELFLTGRIFTGEEAAAMGLANQALETDEVLPTAVRMGRDIAVNVAPLSAALTKRLLWRSPSPDADEVEQLETRYHHHVMGRPDAAEGVLAYLEKREPSWTLTLADDWPDDVDGPVGEGR